MSPSADERLNRAVRSVRKAFGSAVHDAGGTGAHGTGFFLVLNRAPTADELQLLRLLPFDVQLTWGPRLSGTELLREQDAAFAAVHDVLDAFGDTEPQTDAQVFSFYPDRDHPKTAAQVASTMAAAITRISGAPPTFSIRVTDLSRTAEGRAALHVTGRTVSETGIRLLIAIRPTETDSATGIGRTDGDDLAPNADRCVALGGSASRNDVIIAPPGSSISSDGRSFHAAGIGTYPIDPDDAGDRRGLLLGGSRVDAAAAASYLPRGSTLCGGTSFLLLGR